MSKHAFTVIVAVIIAVSLLLYMFAFTVRQNQVAVVMTFGEPVDVEKLPPAGYHFKWPWPIQEVRTFDNRLHPAEGRITETYTRDRHNIITSVFVGWKIGDVLKFNENFGRAEDPIALGWASLDRIVRDKTLAVLGKHDLSELVSADKDPNYTAIETEIMDAAGQQASDTFGIKVEMVKLKRLELPESVTMKVYERMKSERAKEAQSITSSGQQAAQGIRSNAEAERDQILARAKSEAERLRAEGDAEAARYYGVFAKNPELAIYLRKIRALREATRENTTIIVDTTMPPFDLLTQGPPDVKTEAAGNKGTASDGK